MKQRWIVFVSLLGLVGGPGDVVFALVPSDEVAKTAGQVKEPSAILARLSAFVGGRESGSAPNLGTAETNAELVDYLARWDTSQDNAELSNLFALAELGETVRYAKVFPASGGNARLQFVNQAAGFEFDVTLEPQADAELYSAQVRMEKNGVPLSISRVTGKFGERTMVSTRNGPEAPFLFLLIQAERTGVDEAAVSSARADFAPGTARPDGETILHPRLLTRDRMPVYPAAARKNGLEGMVVVDVVIDPSGAVRDARVLHARPEDFSVAALEWAKSLRFEPARQAGKPVEVLYTLTVRFALDPEEKAAAEAQRQRGGG